MGTNVNAPRCPVDHRTLRNSVHKKIDFEEIFSLKLNGNSLPIRWRPYANAWETFKSWVLTFLSKPHPDLGRKGAVCPFTHKSYLLDYFLTNIQETAMPSFEELEGIMLGFKQKLTSLPVNDEADRVFSTIVVLFPNVKESAHDRIEEVQNLLKPSFVNEGLMIGQFFPGCPQPGLHNSEFRPLNSPIPLLAMRNMVESDWPFLVGNPEFEESYKKIFNK